MLKESQMFLLSFLVSEELIASHDRAGGHAMYRDHMPAVLHPISRRIATILFGTLERARARRHVFVL